MGPVGCPEVSVRNYHYIAKYPRIAQISNDSLVVQALAWLCVVWFSAFYAYLR